VHNYDKIVGLVKNPKRGNTDIEENLAAIKEWN